LLVFQNLKSNILFLLVIVAFEDDAEATFAELLDKFVSIAQMLIEATQVLVRVRIEAVVRLIVEYTHL
jgi:hypothetical protein